MKDFKVYASCHNHSTFSDGQYTPEVLCRIAKNMGHGAIILTDHDTTQGYPFMKESAEHFGLKTMIGVELSTTHTFKDGTTLGVHLLGFDFNPEHEALREYIPFCASIQTERSRLLFEFARRSGEMREGVEWQDVLSDHPHHNYLNNNAVFDSFMKRGIYRYDEYYGFLKKFFSYSDREREARVQSLMDRSYDDIKTVDAVRRILDAGGVPVVAHPHGLSKYANEFLAMGVLGFETRHSSVDSFDHEFFESYCEEHNLYKMGGADHENVLGGLLTFGDKTSSAYESSGIDEECFMEIYERRRG